MSFKEKTLAFVGRYGYTYRSYVLSILLFPPAAVYIACKKPGVALPGRVLLNVVAVAAPPVIGAGTLLMIKTAYELIRSAV